MPIDPALLTVIGTIAAAVVTAIGAIVVRRTSRRVDVATIRKTEAETVSIEVQTARSLVAEVKTYFSERMAAQEADHREEIAEIRARYDEQIKALDARLKSMEETQTRWLAALMAHRPWDEDSLNELRRHNPLWPSPPPIDPPEGR